MLLLLIKVLLRVKDLKAGNIYSRLTVDFILNPFKPEYTITAIPRRIRQSTRIRIFLFDFFSRSTLTTPLLVY